MLQNRPIALALCFAAMLFALCGFINNTFAFTYKITDLGTIENGYDSNIYAVNGVNAYGEVVGTCYVYWAISHGYYSNGVDNITDLGTLNGNKYWYGSNAMAINDKGQIVGGSRYADSTVNQHSCLWDNGTIELVPFF